MRILDMPLIEDEVETCFKKKQHKHRKTAQHEGEEIQKFESAIGSNESPRITSSSKEKSSKVKQLENDAKYAHQMPVTSSTQHIYFQDSDFDSYQSYQKDLCSPSWAVGDEVKKVIQAKKPKLKNHNHDSPHKDNIDIQNLSKFSSSKERCLHGETIGSTERQENFVLHGNTFIEGTNYDLNLNEQDAFMVPDEEQLLALRSNKLRKAQKVLEHLSDKDPHHLLPAEEEKSLNKKKHKQDKRSHINDDVETQAFQIDCDQIPRRKSSNKDISLCLKSSVNINGKCEKMEDCGISRDSRTNSTKLPINILEKSSASNKLVTVFEAVDHLSGESSNHRRALNSIKQVNFTGDTGMLFGHPQDHGELASTVNVEEMVAKKKHKQKKKHKLSDKLEVLPDADSSQIIASEDQNFDPQGNSCQNLYPIRKSKKKRSHRKVHDLETVQIINCQHECDSSEMKNSSRLFVEETMKPCNAVVNDLGEPLKKKKRKRERVNGKSNDMDMAQIIVTKEPMAGLGADTGISHCLQEEKKISSVAVTNSMDSEICKKSHKRKRLHGSQRDSINICQAGSSKQNHDEHDNVTENCPSGGGRNQLVSVLSDSIEGPQVKKKHKRAREHSQGDAIGTQKFVSESTKSLHNVFDDEMFKVVSANEKVPVQRGKEVDVAVNLVKGKAVRNDHSLIEQAFSPDTLQFAEVNSQKQFEAADSMHSVKKEEASGACLPSSEHAVEVRGIEPKPVASQGYVLIEDSDESDDSLEVISDTSSGSKAAPTCDRTLEPHTVEQSLDVQRETLSPQVIQSRIVVSKILPNQERWAKRKHLLPRAKGRVKPAKLLFGRPPDGRDEIFLKARTIKELEDAGVEHTTGAWRERELRQLHENIVWYCNFFGVSVDQMLDTDIRPKGRAVYLPLSYKIFRRPWEIWEKFSKLYNPQPEKSGQAFSEQDVSDLLLLRGKYGKNWVHIGKTMGRHRLSVVKKYSRLEDCGLTEVGEPGFVKPPRGPFTAEEDKLIVRAVKSMAADESENIDERKISWRLVARFLGGRTASDCERRWKYHIMAPGSKTQRDLENSHDVIMQKVARYVLSAPVEDFADINWQDVVSACGVAAPPYLIRKQFLKFIQYRIKDFRTKSGTEVLQHIKDHWSRMFKRTDIVIL